MGAKILNVPIKSVHSVAGVLFFLILVVLVIKWSALSLQILAPLTVTAAAGLIVASFPQAWPFKSRFLFVTSYAAAFLLIWAVGKPETQLLPGMTWMTLLLAFCLVAGLIAWNAKDRRGIAWFVAVVCSVGFGLLIAYIAGPRGGADPLIAWIQETFNTDYFTADKAAFVIRKSLHFAGYGLAALCTAQAAYKSGASVATCWAVGLGWPLPIAVYDEWQQTMANNRSGQISDVALDTLGMITFLAAWHWVVRRKQRSITSEN
ncbi:VanZ family protein [Kamptonema cortianum]|nr:VanZ family protein [Geitlerinema splendidum]MDK3158804.1 VanZ family protein [Kamptonema cortianum]